MSLSLAFAPVHHSSVVNAIDAIEFEKRREKRRAMGVVE